MLWLTCQHILIVSDGLEQKLSIGQKVCCPECGINVLIQAFVSMDTIDNYNIINFEDYGTNH